MHIDRQKLDTVLAARGVNLQQLARSAGVSRQSIYAMLRGRSIYNTVFEKLIAQLNVAPDDITASAPTIADLYASMPAPVARACRRLVEFADAHQASVVLFGSRARGKTAVNRDWDFGISFSNRRADRALLRLKQELQDDAFPYRVDIANLDIAPQWFLDSIRHDCIAVCGPSPRIFSKGAA